MERSCGGIIVNGKRYLLIKYGHGHWGFVKGHVERGETAEETFFREAEEETGLSRAHLRISEDFREKIHYFYKREGRTVYKEVLYLLAESSTADVTLSHEHTDYRWLPYEEALEQVTYEKDRNVLKKAHAFLKKKQKD
ncbi:MAG TPA: NUDIX domain-containing protein [Thermoplasmatales archaeon]|nr:NUDIX domain-containing protein [Thermoplasmatales archaeon]